MSAHPMTPGLLSELKRIYDPVKRQSLSAQIRTAVALARYRHFAHTIVAGSIVSASILVVGFFVRLPSLLETALIFLIPAVFLAGFFLMNRIVHKEKEFKQLDWRRKAIASGDAELQELFRLPFSTKLRRESPECLASKLTELGYTDGNTGQDMTRDEFIQAKLFIFSDVEREIQLAKADSGALKALGVTPGGGNFLAALGLLCYTEFGGRLRFGAKRADGSDIASENFNRFFDLLGPDYQMFREKHNVYNIFRCGLAHEYYVKKSCRIYMLADGAGPGIGVETSGRYFFVIERYCQDLKRAFNDLQVCLYGW